MGVGEECVDGVQREGAEMSNIKEDDMEQIPMLTIAFFVVGYLLYVSFGR